MHKDFHFNSSFIIGVFIGGVAALLLSPKSGRKNRDLLSQKLSDAKNTWQNSDGDVQQTLTKLFGSDELDAYYDKARGFMDKKLAEAKMSFADLKKSDLNTWLDELKADFEKTADPAYNESWIERLQNDWQRAKNSPHQGSSRKA